MGLTGIDSELISMSRAWVFGYSEDDVPIPFDLHSSLVAPLRYE
jgi:hypothetical protein